MHVFLASNEVACVLMQSKQGVDGAYEGASSAKLGPAPPLGEWP